MATLGWGSLDAHPFFRLPPSFSFALSLSLSLSLSFPLSKQFTLTFCLSDNEEAAPFLSAAAFLGGEQCNLYSLSAMREGLTLTGESNAKGLSCWDLASSRDLRSLHAAAELL